MTWAPTRLGLSQGMGSHTIPAQFLHNSHTIPAENVHNFHTIHAQVVLNLHTFPEQFAHNLRTRLGLPSDFGIFSGLGFSQARARVHKGLTQDSQGVHTVLTQGSHTV